MTDDIDWDSIVNNHTTGQALHMSAQFAFDYFNALVEKGFTREEALSLTRDIQSLYWNTVFLSVFRGISGKRE